MSRDRDAGRGLTGALLDAAAEFRSAPSARALVDTAPEVLARLGFDRVLISRVDRGVWMPESMSVRRDPPWAADIIQAGHEEPTDLDAVVETDVVDFGRTLVVDEVQSHPRVHRRIAIISRSDNYGVVPIRVDHAVVGMVHADCFFQQRRVTRTECDALALAVETFAAHLGRLLVLDQLQAVRDARWSGPARSPAAPSVLTERERDVVRLMATGRTNQQIGRRLRLTEGTVKTHVSSILRKLGAANRAQAVSTWLRSAGPDPGS